MKKTALITGSLGQDGSYLAQLLVEKNYRVLAARRSSSDLSNHQYLGISDQVEYIELDLRDDEAITKVVTELQPAEIYHLGGLSSPGESWANPREYTMVNSLGMLALLDAVRLHSPQSRLLNAATSEMFGDQHQQGHQTEDTPFRPTNPYAVTKMYAYWMGHIYRQSYNLYVANAILFSHESPLRGERFVTRKITRGVAQIKLGLAKEIVLGNINSKRDWGFAGDYVEAMWRIVQQAAPDDFVLSTGQVHSIRDFLDAAFASVGITDWTPYVRIDPQLYRPIDLPNLYGASDKARRLLNWSPKVSFEDLVKLMVEADIKRCS